MCEYMPVARMFLPCSLPVVVGTPSIVTHTQDGTGRGSVASHTEGGPPLETPGVHISPMIHPIVLNF